MNILISKLCNFFQNFNNSEDRFLSSLCSVEIKSHLNLLSLESSKGSHFRICSASLVFTFLDGTRNIKKSTWNMKRREEKTRSNNTTHKYKKNRKPMNHIKNEHFVISSLFKQEFVSFRDDVPKVKRKKILIIFLLILKFINLTWTRGEDELISLLMWCKSHNRINIAQVHILVINNLLRRILIKFLSHIA